VKTFDTISLVVVAFLAVFWEAAFDGVRRLAGVQPDFLPALMVYAALRGGLWQVCLLAFCGGLFFDSLSSNPLGITVLPLLAIGVALNARSALILQNQVFAQTVLGATASLAAPGLTLILLLTLGAQPLIGWGTLWQLAMMTAVGATAAPCFFLLFDWLRQTFSYAETQQPSFRPDREILRGR